MRLINSKEYEQFGRVYGPQIYGYLVGILVLTVFGMILQGYFVPETPEEKEEKTIVKKDDFIKTDIQNNTPNTGENKNATQAKEDENKSQVDETNQKGAEAGETHQERKEN
jgi:hypothetical protein